MMADESKTATHEDAAAAEARAGRSADMSVWIIWGAIMLVAVGVLPFAVRSHDVVRAIASMCGFDLG